MLGLAEMLTVDHTALGVHGLPDIFDNPCHNDDMHCTEQRAKEVQAFFLL